jgi:hypothetical protein
MKIELTHQEISALVASILFMTKDILETEGMGDEKVMLVDCYTSIINKITEDEEETTMKKQIRVYDIKWFYNYEDHMDDQTKEEYDKTFNAEPTEMIVDVSDWTKKDLREDWIEVNLSNYISDESGYYHKGFDYEWVKEETIRGVITKPKSQLEDLIEFSKEFVENKL